MSSGKIVKGHYSFDWRTVIQNEVKDLIWVPYDPSLRSGRHYNTRLLHIISMILTCHHMG